MYENYEAVCLNGIIKAGDEIITTPLTDYPTMRGRVLYIHPEGSPEQREESSNGNCDNVHVALYTASLAPKRIAEIEAHFTELYGRPLTMDDIALDDDIECGEVLININEVDEDYKKNCIDQSEALAQAAALKILADYAFEKAKRDRDTYKRGGNGNEYTL